MKETLGPNAPEIIAVSNAEGGEIPQGIETQTKQVLDNLTKLLTEVGSSLEQVLKVTVFLSDMQNFAAMNQVYANYFTEQQPSRTAAEVSRLPLHMLVLFEVIASQSRLLWQQLKSKKKKKKRK